MVVRALLQNKFFKQLFCDTADTGGSYGNQKGSYQYGMAIVD